MLHPSCCCCHRVGPVLGMDWSSHLGHLTFLRHVSEETQNNVVVLADYVVILDDHSHSPTISTKVCSNSLLSFNS
ncbi:hypothetical protein ACFX2J_031433 [Malus domestica]